MSDEQTPAPARGQLWYTSNSAHARGTQHCAFARYVDYHAGPYGYGFSRKAMSLPLATGSYTHYGLGGILQWVLDYRKQNGVQPDTIPDEVIRWGADLAVEKYTQVVSKRGILKYAMDDPESLAKLQLLIKEQTYLIEGLTWAWCLQRLPIYLRDYLLVEIEGEQELVLECTCGLGNRIGSFEEHEARGCHGIGHQSAPDILGIRKADNEMGYTEFKTSGIPNKAQDDAWERKAQFILGMAAAERRHGVRVTHGWVEVLVKGKRDRDYPYTAEQPKKQKSPFCYAYYAPANSPGSFGQWRPAYTYRTALDETFTAGKKEGYKSTALWEPPKDEAWPGVPEGMSTVEYWARVMGADFPYHLAKQVHVVGPIARNDEQLEKAIRSVIAEEHIWQDRLWKIYEFSQQTGKQWGDDEFHEFLEVTIPRSWNCDPFADHPCINQPICFPVTEDWRQPIESELYVYRTPHHRAELEQIKQRGLVPPGSELALEEGEQEEGDGDGRE